MRGWSTLHPTHGLPMVMCHHSKRTRSSRHYFQAGSAKERLAALFIRSDVMVFASQEGYGVRLSLQMHFSLQQTRSSQIGTCI